MGRNRKSHDEKIVDLTAERNKNRHNYDEPKPAAGIGDPPKSLRAPEKRIWHELIENSYAGVLGEGDRFALEILCRLMFRWRHGNRKTVEPLKTGELNRLTALLSQFGMTPATRPNVAARKRSTAAGGNGGKPDEGKSPNQFSNLDK